MLRAKTLRPRENCRHFTDNMFKCIFLSEDVWISIKVSLNSVNKGSINNIPALNPIMDWRRLGNKPLSEPMMVSLLTHICITRPHWVIPLNSLDFNSLAPGTCVYNPNKQFLNSHQGQISSNISCLYCPQVNATRPHWWLVNVGSGNGLVPLGNKPLPEPLMTQINVTHMASIISHKGLMLCSAFNSV